MRCNIICIEGDNIKNHSAGHITTEEADVLIQYLEEKLGTDRIHFYTGVQYRHLLVIKGGNKQLDCTPPHDVPLKPFRPLMVKAGVPEAQETAELINTLILKSQELLAEHPINKKRIAEGKDPANSIWPWSPGYRPQMEPLAEKYPVIRKGAVISAVDLINGIGYYAGLRRITVQGATGLYDTNYENKVAAALEALRTDDFVYLHIEASDEAGHEGDFKLKQFTIENLDKRVVGHEAHPHLTAADAAGGVEHARQGLQLIGGKVGRQAEDLQPGLVAQGLGLCRLGLDAAQLQRAFVAGPVAQGKGDVFRLFLRHFGHAPLHAVVAQLLQQADGLLDAVFRHAHGKNAEFHKYTPFSDDAARGFADRLLHFKYTRLRAGGKTHFLRS